MVAQSRRDDSGFRSPLPGLANETVFSSCGFRHRQMAIVPLGTKQILRNISVESTIITRRVSEGFTPPSLAYASGYEIAQANAETANNTTSPRTIHVAKKLCRGTQTIHSAATAYRISIENITVAAKSNWLAHAAVARG